MLLKWEAFVNTATSGWGSGKAMQRSKSVYNMKPASAVRSGRLRKQEGPCGDPYSSSLFALLFLPTELREWGRDLAIKTWGSWILLFLGDSIFKEHLKSKSENERRFGSRWVFLMPELQCCYPDWSSSIGSSLPESKLTLGFLIKEQWLRQRLSEGMKGGLSFLETQRERGKDAWMSVAIKGRRVLPCKSSDLLK